MFLIENVMILNIIIITECKTQKKFLYNTSHNSQNNDHEYHLIHLCQTKNIFKHVLNHICVYRL